MRTILTAVILPLILLQNAAGGNEKTNETKAPPPYLVHEGITYNMDYLDNSFGIKLKSIRVEKKDTLLYAVLLLQFSKDVTDVKALRRAFAKPEIGFYEFDADNVTVGLTFSTQEGSLTGKKGDAFRLRVQIITAGANVAKIEARLHEDED